MTQEHMNDIELNDDTENKPISADRDHHEAKDTESEETEGVTETQTWIGAAWKVGEGILNVADFLGEVFAEFFGMTQSRYQWAIDAYERQQRWEREDREREKLHKNLAMQEIKKQKQHRKNQRLLQEQLSQNDIKLAVSADRDVNTNDVDDTIENESEANVRHLSHEHCDDGKEEEEPELPVRGTSNDQSA